MNIVATLCLSVAFVVTFAFAFHYWQRGNFVAAIGWGLAAWILVEVGAAALVLNSVPASPVIAAESTKIDSAAFEQLRARLSIVSARLTAPLEAGSNPEVQLSRMLKK